MKPRIDTFKFYDLVIYAARGSNSARRLSTAIGCRRWRDDLPERYTRRRPYFRGNQSPVVINWGSTVHPHWLDDKRFRLTPIWINRAEACRRAIDKGEFFKSLNGKEGIPLLKNTSSRDDVEKWIGKGHSVVARKTLTGSSGAGIVHIQNMDQFIEAPLYTRYYPKTHEFRVHVWRDQIIDFTQKKLKGGPNDSANRLVRSHDNGWVHCHDNLSIGSADQESMGRSCAMAVSGLGLDFGAVDVLAILNDSETGVRNLKSFVICEVNTGPGLENNKTIEAYTKAILQEKNNVLRV